VTRAVLFDFDGTLIDTWRLYLEAFRRAMEPHFLRFLTDAEILALEPTAERRLFERIVDRAKVEDFYESFLHHYRSLHRTHCDGLYPGIAELLRVLRKDRYAIGVITGKSRKAWDLTFAESSIEAFDVVITDDDVAQPKPHPEGLQAALGICGIQPYEALYIGDSLLDCRAARAAEVPFGAALWSKHPDDARNFQDAVTRLVGPDRCFIRPSAVWDALRAEKPTAAPGAGGSSHDA
jgi:HAD superfamily hydrolase (TIGR01509 family)